MRALAEFIMRGRVQATLVVAGCAALPLLYWLGAAAGGLVRTRRSFTGCVVRHCRCFIGWVLLQVALCSCGAV